MLIVQYTGLCSFSEIEPNRFPLVERLFLGTPLEFDLGVPQKCRNLWDLAVLGFGRPAEAGMPPTMNNDFWSCPGLTPSHVTVYEADCGFFIDHSLSAPAALRQCTHLSLENMETDLASASHLLTLLPTVTHLALYYDHPKLFEVRGLKGLCKAHPRLKIITIVHFIAAQEWDNLQLYFAIVPTPQANIPSRYERKDKRIALVHIRSQKYTCLATWGRVALGSEDIWELGRQRLRALGGKD